MQSIWESFPPLCPTSRRLLPNPLPAMIRPSLSTTIRHLPPRSPFTDTYLRMEAYPPHGQLITSRQNSKSSIHHGQKESVLLTLHPQSHSVASEWLDGLLMLLNQQPITAETSKLVNMVSSYGLKIRLLNVRFDERDMMGDAPEMPSREGLDEDYYYDIFGGQ